MSINAFVGHSFNKRDTELVRKFLDFFNNVSKMGIDFHWDHAEEARPKELPAKVIEKMEGKNLFIGICTPRQRSIDLNKLSSLPLMPNYLWGSEKNFETKISDWILQEIGFSVGRRMDIILLLEDGVAEPGGLQGNIEYIPFRRNNPEESFNKILEMLNWLAESPISKAIAEPSKTSEALAEKETVSTGQASEDKPILEWTLDDYGIRFLHSIAEDDKVKEEEINNSFFNSKFAADPSNVARWDAFRLFMHITWGKENRLNELLELMEKNPHNRYVIDYVARVYTEYGEHKRAATYYEKSALVAETPEDKFWELSKASLAYAKSGDKNQALSHIKDCISIVREDPKLTIDLLTTLADLSAQIDDADNYKVFTEALLERTPEDYSKRFSLALKYAEDNENDTASLHYGILSTRNPNGANWNNLGVALSNLNLPASAVNAYREAERLNETLAMSNLAQKYISAGFLDDATELTNKATSIKNYNQAIGKAISKIQETLEQENKEYAKLMEFSNTRRQFYIDYSEKYLKDDIQFLPESWSNPRCMLKLSIDKNTFEMVGEFDEPKASPPSWMPTPSFPAANKETPEKNYIKYIGKINGSSIKFDYWISKGKMPQTESDKPKGSGLMIVEDSKQKIRVYEKGLKDNSAFTEITGIST